MGRVGSSAAGAEAQAGSESELAGIKELGVRMFKQVGLGSKQGVSALHC